MATAVAVNGNISNQNKTGGFLVGVKVLKANQKDVLRTIRFSLEWIKVFFQDLSSFTPIKNMITFIKGGEDSFSFGELAQSACKIAHALTTSLSNGIVNTIKALTRAMLEMTWNVFKVCKILQNYAIVSFSGAFFMNLMALGGISFATSSADRAYHEAKHMMEIERNSDVKQKDATVIFHLYRLAKNIGTFAIGLIVSIKAICGYVAPGMFMLLIGTTILVSNISAIIVKETYQLQIK